MNIYPAACVVLFLLVAAAPTVAQASARVTEIMYDLPGTDTGREWIEIQNTGSDEILFGKWKLFEANTNHALALFQGTATTSAGGFAVIADDTTKFLADNPQYASTLFASSFSLSNSGETLELREGGITMNQALYASTTGAAGDGMSLQLVGSVWEARAPTPGSAASGGEAVPPSTTGSHESAATSTQSTTPDSPPPGSSKGGATWMFTPQIYVNAFVPSHGAAGAPLIFDAVAVGAKKEPIQNARYIWSFGDGGTREGKKVEHTYHYPASYVVMVTASSGEWNATDRKEIKITAPKLALSAIREGGDGFIELRNDGEMDIDLSYWILISGSGLFTVPQGTVIATKKSIPFPAAITGLFADSASTALLYPNGSTAATYTHTPTAPESPAQPVEQKALAIVPPAESRPRIVAVAPPPAPRQEIAAAPARSEEPEGASAPTASSTALLSAVGAAKTGSAFPWLGGTAFLTLLAVGGYLTRLLLERGPTAAELVRKEAEEYDLVE